MTPAIDTRMMNWTGRIFYALVALIALTGQTWGATVWLHVPWHTALPAAAVVEIGGVYLAQRADMRRQLGERAIATSLLSRAVAAFAVAFNWLSHADHLVGGFFAGVSALAYLMWLIQSADRRRDRLRPTGKLSAQPPAYGPLQWLREPHTTWLAQQMCKADAELGLYESLERARLDLATRRKRAAIAAVLRRKISNGVSDPLIAQIAVLVYDLDEIAEKIAADADIPRLAGLFGAELDQAVLAAGTPVIAGTGRRRQRGTGDGAVPVPVPAGERELTGTGTGTRRAIEGGTGTAPATGTGTASDAGTGTAHVLLLHRPAGTGTGTGRGRAEARRYWDEQVALGNTPTGAQLARALEVTGSMGRRWAREFRDADAAEAEVDAADAV